MFIFYYKNFYLKLIKNLFYSKKVNRFSLPLFFNNSFRFIFFKILKIKIFLKFKFISIPTYTDSVISITIKQLLEEVLEKKFKFLFYKDIFSVFNVIQNWSCIRWCISGHILKFFQFVDLILLGQFLFFYMHDILFLNLYFRFLSAGYFTKQTNYLFYFFLGKNNSLGFLLINIYLYAFDCYMKKIQKFYFSVFNKIKKFTCSNFNFFYIRFGFTWLIGIVSSINFVVFLKQKIKQYFFRFLHLIFLKKHLKIVDLCYFSCIFNGIQIVLSRNFNRILLLCPFKLIICHLKYFGFLKNLKSNIIPCAQRKWLFLTLKEIFWKFYLLKIRLLKFYFFVQNRFILKKLKFFLRMSLIFTLGRKLQLSKKQIYMKFQRSILKWMF